MIKRINLIEKPRFQITYVAIFFGIGISVFTCLLFFGSLYFSQRQAAKHVEQLVIEIEQLKALREKLMSAEEIAQGSGPIAEIQLALRRAPPWSHLLSTISTSLPSNVWLSSIKSFDKEGAPPKKALILNGEAKNPQALAQFLAVLGKSQSFENVGLTTSKEEEGIFNFTATCDIGSRIGQ